METPSAFGGTAYSRGRSFTWRVTFAPPAASLLPSTVSHPCSRTSFSGSRWLPVRRPRLAAVTARLCRLLRKEVTEQLERRSPSLTNLAKDWRKLLFPSATDAAFADGYAQAVTFGLLMARARNITLANGLDRVAYELRQTNTLIGSALRLLTDDADSQATLKTSLATLSRVLDAVDWPAVSKGDPEAWLYFYEDFLSAYDNELRKKTGSYYTPPEVVRAMVRLVDEALQSEQRFGLSEGLASPDVVVADPAVGTGTYLLGILRRIAVTTTTDQGAGRSPRSDRSRRRTPHRLRDPVRSICRGAAAHSRRASVAS